MSEGNTSASATVTAGGVELAPDARIAVAVDRDLPKGLAANAAAILAATLGARHPSVVGEDFPDGSGDTHLGLIPKGLPILAAEGSDLPALRAAALERGLFVADLPIAGQTTTDYREFRDAVAESDRDSLGYVAILVAGPPKAVGKVTGRLGLLR